MLSCSPQSSLNHSTRSGLGPPAFATIQLHRQTRQHVCGQTRAEITTDRPVPWKSTLLGLGISGAIGGTLMDGIHSRVPLQVYDIGAFSFLGLNSSVLVPPILVSFYIVFGTFQILADRALIARPSTQEALSKLSPQYLLVNTCVLAAIIYTSATLHGMEVPTPQIGAVLAAITLVNWTVFDRTPQGALLAVLCGVGAPLSEVILNAVFGLWHYPREDLPGMVSWVPWCYASYVPALGNWARYLWLYPASGAGQEGFQAGHPFLRR